MSGTACDAGYVDCENSTVENTNTTDGKETENNKGAKDPLSKNVITEAGDAGGTTGGDAGNVTDQAKDSIAPNQQYDDTDLQAGGDATTPLVEYTKDLKNLNQQINKDGDSLSSELNKIINPIGTGNVDWKIPNDIKNLKQSLYGENGDENTPQPPSLKWRLNSNQELYNNNITTLDSLEKKLSGNISESRYKNKLIMRKLLLLTYNSRRDILFDINNYNEAISEYIG